MGVCGSRGQFCRASGRGMNGMPVEYRKEDGRLVWVRSPFTGRSRTSPTSTRSRAASAPQPGRPATPPPDWEAAEAARLAELEAARRDCPFCPGNEELTTAEVLRVTPDAVDGRGADDVHVADPRLHQPDSRAFPSHAPAGATSRTWWSRIRATSPTAPAITTSCSTPRCCRWRSSAPSCAPTWRSRGSPTPTPPCEPS